jgi:hypothetical protein
MYTVREVSKISFPEERQAVEVAKVRIGLISLLNDLREDLSHLAERERSLPWLGI